jgi:hypothetical protein
MRTRLQGFGAIFHFTHISCNVVEASIIKGYEGQRQRTRKSPDPRGIETVVRTGANYPSQLGGFGLETYLT